METSYSVILADDDFLILDTVDKAVTALHEDPGLSCIAGRVANLKPFGGGRWLVENYHQVGYDEPDARARLRQFGSLFPTTFYSVKRTPDSLANFAAGIDFGGYHPFWEQLIIWLDALRGRIGILDDLYCLRRVHEAQWSRDLDDQPNYILDDPEFPAKFGIFRDQAAAAMVDRLGGSVQEARKFIVDTYVSYLGIRGMTPSKYPHPWVLTKRAQDGNGDWLKRMMAARGRGFNELGEVLRLLSQTAADPARQ